MSAVATYKTFGLIQLVILNFAISGPFTTGVVMAVAVFGIIFVWLRVVPQFFLNPSQSDKYESSLVKFGDRLFSILALVGLVRTGLYITTRFLMGPWVRDSFPLLPLLALTGILIGMIVIIFVQLRRDGFDLSDGVHRGFTAMILLFAAQFGLVGTEHVA